MLHLLSGILRGVLRKFWRGREGGISSSNLNHVVWTHKFCGVARLHQTYNSILHSLQLCGPSKQLCGVPGLQHQRQQPRAGIPGQRSAVQGPVCDDSFMPHDRVPCSHPFLQHGRCHLPRRCRDGQSSRHRRRLGALPENVRLENRETSTCISVSVPPLTCKGSPRVEGNLGAQPILIHALDDMLASFYRVLCSTNI